MNGGQGDVKRVIGGTWRHNPFLNDALCESRRVITQVQQRKWSQEVEPSLGYSRVARPRFSHHQLRHIYLEVLTAALPPFPRNLLTRGLHQIPARLSHKVADDGGFEIDPSHFRTPGVALFGVPLILWFVGALVQVRQRA